MINFFRKSMRIELIMGIFFGFLTLFLAFFSKSGEVFDYIFCILLSISFFATIIPSFKEYYFWNNGICRKTGKYWIKVKTEHYEDGDKYVSGENQEFVIFIKNINTEYDDEKSKLFNQQYKTINNLKNFDI